MNEQPTYWAVQYKSGAYIAKAIEAASPRILVEMAAVLRHPLQGDLHHPYEAEVPLFHERRAASQREKVWVHRSDAEPYDGPIPAYDASLRDAWEQLVQAMQQMKNNDPDRAEWAAKSLEKLNELERDYWK
ncbi:MAG: kinase [Paenibacillus sp.]|jgi:kinase-associated protein B|nr:kinase [Paenibacillus sp.]